MSSDLVFSLALSIGFALTALYVAIARRHRPSWKAGVVVLLACAEITLAYTLRGASANLNGKVFWYDMSLLGFSISSTFFCSLALQYIHAKNEIKPRALLGLSVFPALNAAVIFTNEYHGLVLNPDTAYRVVERTLFPTADEAGIWYWIFIAYTFFIIGLGCYLIIQWIVQSKGFYSRQAMGVLIAAVIALAASAFDIFHASPFPPFMATAGGLAIGTITVAYALIPLRRNDVLAVSRGAILHTIEDCIIVVDDEEQIAFVNPAAEILMGHTNAFLVGKPLKQFLPALRSVHIYEDNENWDVILQHRNQPHTFSLRISTIHDWSGKTSSRVIVLRDITEYKQAEAQGYQADLREAQELVKWHIHHIRQAIEPDIQNPTFIINVRGSGYRLVVD